MIGSNRKSKKFEVVYKCLYKFINVWEQNVLN